MTHYDHENGLPSDAVFDILEDDQGRLWLSTSNGLSRFDPRSETFRNYDEQDGLPGKVFESAVAFQSPDGEMFFGATDGLLAFYPDQIHDKLTAPPVVVTDLLLANKPVPIGGGSVLRQAIDETPALVLSYLDRVISFEFAALNYIAPQKNRYRYTLEGFDKGWTEVGSDRRLVTYTNLDPGRYVFRVLGSNNDGIWNEEGAALALTITPPWWETTWFRISSVFLMVGLVTGGFVWQRRRAVVQERKLEAMVDERTRDLQDARTQIKTLFDSSPLGIAVATFEGKILGVNPAMQRMTGYSEDELLASNVRALYAYPEQRARVLEKLGATGFLSDYGIQMRRRDGSVYYASLNLSRLEMAGQEVLLGTLDDVTEQVEARQALTTLHQMSYDMASITELQALIDHAVPHLSQIVDFQRAALMLIEEGEESLTIHAYLSPTLPPELTFHQVAISSWPSLATVLQGREAAYVPDMQASETIRAELDGIEPEWWAAALKASRSWLSLPLLRRGAHHRPAEPPARRCESLCGRRHRAGAHLRQPARRGRRQYPPQRANRADGGSRRTIPDRPRVARLGHANPVYRQCARRGHPAHLEPRPGHRAAEHGKAQRTDPRRVGRDAVLAGRIAYGRIAGPISEPTAQYPGGSDARAEQHGRLHQRRGGSRAAR